jgi:hypothetical protein
MHSERRPDFRDEAGKLAREICIMSGGGMIEQLLGDDIQRRIQSIALLNSVRGLALFAPDGWRL